MIPVTTLFPESSSAISGFRTLTYEFVGSVGHKSARNSISAALQRGEREKHLMGKTARESDEVKEGDGE